MREVEGRKAKGEIRFKRKVRAKSMKKKPAMKRLAAGKMST